MVQIVSFLGGLFKGISVFLFVLLWPFREIMYYKKLINNMFSVCTTEDDLQKAFGYLVDEDDHSSSGSELAENEDLENSLKVVDNNTLNPS